MIKNIFDDINGLDYVENDNHAVIHGDSLNVLKRIKNDAFNLMFADPPYNIGKTFGNSKENWDKKSYIDWCKTWIDESMRILKPDGVLCFMTATQFMPYLDCYVDSKYDVFSRIIWNYDSSGVQNKSNFGSMYEPIIIVAKDKKLVKFNKDAALTDAKTGSARKLIDYRKTPPRIYNEKKILGNVWNMPRVRFKMEEYETHPTQKPEKLLERIITIFTDVGDIVIDPFAGSFTTGSVAKKFDRRSVSIEIEEEYYKIGLRRLNLATKYKNEDLVKVKKRLTKNKSKRNRRV